MSGRCCCGCCKLSTGTSVALVFAGIEAILNILINAELLLLINENYLITNPFRLVINIRTIEDFDVFHGIVLTAVGINAFWLCFAIFAATGNIYQSHGRLTPWTFITYLLSMFHFGVSVYFAVIFQSSYSDMQEFYTNSIPTRTLTYLTLVCIYSGGGILLFFNLFLTHVVERRGKEIDQDYSALALYILSHMSRCSPPNDRMQQHLLPEAPPSYDTECPQYLPPEIYRRQSSASSWSLSYEALKSGSTSQTNPAAVTSPCRSVSTTEQSASINQNATTSYQILNVDTDTYATTTY